ncbi:siderophore-interacting protein [Phytoactinopolyspora alkaliphila]|uniref:Siderophore-interacting protein n=1 Tax=Phytoactinopolyspora alkaliphila TaxID=1783498 RepID=A0A6N9YG85_9ACTN|nr:siderophore-interacting protein [Phytoactinopolyspora alkaliphila]NED93972.1 siderophore-interacting protein [Phytoactinopolyspora alkaliphila]
MHTRLPIRYIHAVRVERLTPRMARITFTGEHLTDLATSGPDQQIKLYFPRPGQTTPRLPDPEPDGDVMRWYQAFLALPEEERPWMRSFTIRAHRPQSQEIDVDVVLHGDAGPAASWARSARPGDTLAMFGPAAEYARPVPLLTSITGADWLLMAGDETALPAMATILEALPEGTRAEAYIEVEDAAGELALSTRGDVSLHWLHRSGRPAGLVLVDAVRGARFPAGSVFAWLAGEAGSVRALRRHLVDDRGVAKSSIDFTGYWRLTLSQDDAPTEQDLADARQRLADHTPSKR